ncbi:MAG: hypothetical protein RDV48_08120 [Candidatus Eremiobacteraeota bacterium]|nr:hypothetical protein [Candidatus Eremiobacteraeota bacterium]
MDRRLGLILFLLTTLFFSFPAVPASPGTAPLKKSLPDASWVLLQIKDRNRKLLDFTATMDITVYAYLMRFPLTAELSFKKPDKVKMEFTRVPSWLKARESTFRTALPTETLYRSYKSRVIGIETERGKQCYALRMTAPDRGNVKNVYLWVDSCNFTPRKFYLSYRDGGTVELENEFASFGGFHLITRQKITFDLPEFTAKALVKYSGYRVNQQLSDEIFRKKESPLPGK